jgi:hypothetical protein
LEESAGLRNRLLAEKLNSFPQSFNDFNRTGVRVVSEITKKQTEPAGKTALVDGRNLVASLQLAFRYVEAPCGPYQWVPISGAAVS